MKNRPSRVGLVAEGNTIQSTILRFDKLADDLGPVKSNAMGTARRLSNNLRCGYPVADYEGLEAAALILIRVPDASLTRVVKEIAESGLDLAGLAFLLCESWHNVDIFDALKQKGAEVATVMTLPLEKKDWFVTDGDSKAMRLARRFIEANGGRVTELDANGKHFLFVSELLINALPVPLFATAQQTLRSSGFSGNLLSAVLEQMLLRTVRDVMRSAKGHWGGPLLDCPEEVSTAHLNAVTGLRPDLSTFLKTQLDLARGMMEERK